MFDVAVTSQQMKQIDRYAIEQIGIPSVALMENAGRAVAAEVLKDIHGNEKASALIVCGSGNNAGDGFVAARHLFNAGVNPKVVLLLDKDVLSGDALINFNVLVKMGVLIDQISSGNYSFAGDLANSRIIVDAVFGIGLNREITDPLKGIIEHINRINKKVYSVDVPSGLDATSGEIRGICVKATGTVTFHRAKKGFYLNNGPEYCGDIVVSDIGIPG